eukprot:7536749-Karenia_brevis.AAC.1
MWDIMRLGPQHCSRTLYLRSLHTCIVHSFACDATALAAGGPDIDNFGFGLSSFRCGISDLCTHIYISLGCWHLNLRCLKSYCACDATALAVRGPDFDNLDFGPSPVGC